MREVASFINMYPSYKLRDVLSMPASAFFTLLNDGYRNQNQKYYMLAHIVRSANAKDNDFKDFIKQLEWASMHPSDILKPSGNSSSANDIKKLLGG